MAEKSIKANYIYNAAYQVLTLITPLITTPYLSRVLMADGIGLYSYAESIITYFVFLTGMGISVYGQREISYLQDNIEERSRVFWNLKSLSLINLTVFLSLYIFLVLRYAGNNLNIYLIMSVHIILQAFDVAWFFYGMEEFKKIILANIIVRVCNIAFTFIFIKQKSDLIIHVASMAFFAVINTLILWSLLAEYIRRPEIKTLRPFRNIKNIMMFFIPYVAVIIYSVLDKTMLGLLTKGSFENGYYEQAMKIARLSMMLIISLGSVMIPRIGYLFGKNDHEQIKSYMYVSYRFIWFLGTALCLGLTGISDNFVPWFFGDEYEKVSGLMKISSFLVIAVSIENITGTQYLIPTKREKIFNFTVIIGLALNFVLNIILIPVFKSYGAVIASLISEIIIALIQLYMVRDELSITYIAVSGKNYFVSGIIMLLILRFMNGHLYPSLINTFIMIFTGAFVYVIMLLILRDNFFIDYSKRTLKGIISRLHR